MPTPDITLTAVTTGSGAIDIRSTSSANTTTASRATARAYIQKVAD